LTYQSVSGSESRLQETVTTPAIINQIDRVVGVALTDPRYYEMQVQNISQVHTNSIREKYSLF